MQNFRNNIVGSTDKFKLRVFYFLVDFINKATDGDDTGFNVIEDGSDVKVVVNVDDVEMLSIVFSPKFTLQEYYDETVAKSFLVSDKSLYLNMCYANNDCMRDPSIVTDKLKLDYLVAIFDHIRSSRGYSIIETDIGIHAIAPYPFPMKITVKSISPSLKVMLSSSGPMFGF